MEQSNHGIKQSGRKQSTNKVINNSSNHGTNQSENEAIMGQSNQKQRNQVTKQSWTKPIREGRNHGAIMGQISKRTNQSLSHD